MKYQLIIFLLVCFIWMKPLSVFSQRISDDDLTCEISVPSGGSYQSSVYASKVLPSPVSLSIFPGSQFPLPGLESLPLDFTIEGINFDENAANTGYYQIPPDPIGAAGPGHLVSVVNSTIEWFTKAGVTENSQTLQNFFNPLSPTTLTFDPKVIYDQYASRFVVVTLEQIEAGTNPNPGNISRILLAVSDDSDPNGTWYFHAINAKTVISSWECWADYPGFAVDEEAIYVTANMFAFYPRNISSAVRLWIINKGLGSGGFYDGGTASVNVYNPYALDGTATTTQPTHIFGSNLPSTVGTFLVSYSGLSDGTDEYIQVVRVNNPLGSPSFTQQYVNIGNIEGPNFPALPDAPQSGTAIDIEVNDRRALHAVWRDTMLYLVAEILPNSGPDVSQTTAHWWKLNTNNINSIVLEDQGNIGGEDIATGTYTFFPSIAVDDEGNTAIGFSASAPTIYPGAYYTGRLSNDPPGTIQASEVLRVGLDYYIRTFGTPGTDRNRWGDFSGISVDPADGQTFWVFNEYAIESGTAFGGEDGRWGTAFGSFAFTISANIKVFLEGPFNSTTMLTALQANGDLPVSQPYNISPWNYNGTESVLNIPADVVDWILVELRTGTSSSTKIKTRAAFLKSDGSIVDLDGISQVKFTGVASDDYYLVVHHRNHLPVMSAAAQSLSYSSSLFDFTLDLNNAYGSNSMVSLPGGVFGLWGGDADASGLIDGIDRTVTWDNRNLNGYQNSDCVLSGTVDANDRSIVWNNRNHATNVP
jgi:hypothetical protein